VIIFVSQRTAAEELSENLVKFNFRSAALHGEKTQSERDSIFAKFKKVCFCALPVQSCRVFPGDKMQIGRVSILGRQ
jgi:hypothetical protein